MIVGADWLEKRGLSRNGLVGGVKNVSLDDCTLDSCTGVMVDNIYGLITTFLFKL